ncbi:MAG: hypothetical protein ACKO85_17100, partial [Isosphaeraceae bacterium]
MKNHRRKFIGSVTAAGTSAFLSLTNEKYVVAASPEALIAQQPRRKMAVITTEWRYHSHAWHMAERFLVGYPKNGKWHRPPFDVVSAYVDQFPEKDLARKREAEFG